MANTNTLRNDKSVAKDCSPCNEGSTEYISVDDEAMYTDVKSICSNEYEDPDTNKYTTMTEIGRAPAPRQFWLQNSNKSTPVTTNEVLDRPKTNNVDVIISYCNRWKFILIAISISFLVMAISIICLSIIFAEISKLKASQQPQDESIFMFQLEQINTSIQDQITTLSREEIDARRLFDMQLSTLHNQTQQLSDSNTQLLKNPLFQFPYPAASCAALPPSSPSGYYWVSPVNGLPTLAYCTMSCGTHTGGWTKVAFLDMTDSNHQCPHGLIQRTDSGKRTCVRNDASAGCTSVELSTAGIQYSKVCGRVIAYQFGTSDGFSSDDINSTYLDGVSLTHGSSRQHIWSFVTGYAFCDGCRVNDRPGSVGNDFFCDTGTSDAASANGVFYDDNPLWDGNGCTNTDDPYFLKTSSQPTTNNIEMRVCRDQEGGDEDIAIEIVEIYVQ